MKLTKNYNKKKRLIYILIIILVNIVIENYNDVRLVSGVKLYDDDENLNDSC